MNKLVCPNCGANVSADSSKEIIKCQFCSSEFTNPNYNDVIIINDRKFSREEVANKGKEIIEKRAKMLKRLGWALLVAGILTIISSIIQFFSEEVVIGDAVSSIIAGIVSIIIGVMFIKKWHFPIGKKINAQDPIAVGKKYYEKRVKSPSRTVVAKNEYGDPYNLIEDGKIWVIQKYVVTYEDGHKEMTEERHPA